MTLRAAYSSSSNRCTYVDEVVCYTAVAGGKCRVVVPTHNDMRLQFMYACHGTPINRYCGL